MFTFVVRKFHLLDNGCTEKMPKRIKNKNTKLRKKSIYIREKCTRGNIIAPEREKKIKRRKITTPVNASDLQMIKY